MEIIQLGGTYMFKKHKNSGQIPCRIDDIVRQANGLYKVSFWQYNQAGEEDVRKSIAVLPQVADGLIVGSVMSLSELRNISIL